MASRHASLFPIMYGESPGSVRHLHTSTVAFDYPLVVVLSVVPPQVVVLSVVPPQDVNIIGTTISNIATTMITGMILMVLFFILIAYRQIYNYQNKLHIFI